VENRATCRVTAVTESYNGTNWTEVSDLNQARRTDYRRFRNIIQSALAFGGMLHQILLKQKNGMVLSWTETTDLSTARR
jgi:hypothetical protein